MDEPDIERLLSALTRETLEAETQIAKTARAFDLTWSSIVCVVVLAVVGFVVDYGLPDWVYLPVTLSVCVCGTAFGLGARQESQSRRQGRCVARRLRKVYEMASRVVDVGGRSHTEKFELELGADRARDAINEAERWWGKVG